MPRRTRAGPDHRRATAPTSVTMALGAVLAGSLASCLAPATPPQTTPPAATPASAPGVPVPSGQRPDPSTHPGTSATTPRGTGPSGIPTTREPPVEDWRSGARVEGIDVSPYQPSVDWGAVSAAGLRFVWIKASEGATWRSPTFAAQRAGARAAGVLQGAYHYARPASSSGAAQARHFVASGGGWSSDGATLPGALDLEAAERGDPCHARTPAQLIGWVREFSDTYRSLTGRAPVVYVRTDLWTRCLADDRSVGATNPLWLFDHEGEVGPWPRGWSRPTIWQRGVVPVAGRPMDRNVWFGTLTQLRDFAARP